MTFIWAALSASALAWDAAPAKDAEGVTQPSVAIAVTRDGTVFDLVRAADSAPGSPATTLLALGPDLAVKAETPVQAVAVTTDGEDVLVCGAAGLQSIPWSDGAFGTPRTLDAAPCKAIAVRHGSAGASLVIDGDQVVERAITPSGGLGAPVAIGTIGAAPLLVAHGDRVAIGSIGSPDLMEVSDWGRSFFATGGPIGGVAFVDSRWVWSLPASAELADQAHGRTTVAGNPGRLSAVDLDGDGADDLLVDHHGAVGALLANVEVSFTATPGLGSLAVADVDQDGCVDVVGGTATGAVLLRGECGGITSSNSNTNTTTSQFTDGAHPGEIPFGRTMHLDATVGLPLAAKVVDEFDPNATFNARGGPPGFVLLADGTIDYQPDADHIGEYEVTIREGDSLLSTASTLYLTTHPEGSGDFSVNDRVPDDGSWVDTRPNLGGIALDDCVAAFGLAAGASNVAGTWDAVGRQSNYEPSISPAASLSCELRLAPAFSVFAGGDSAPTFTYLASRSLKFEHLAVGSAGLMFGGDKFRMGPYAAVGVFYAGTGLRGVWMPFQMRRGSNGLEVRAAILIPSTPAAEVMVMWGFQTK